MIGRAWIGTSGWAYRHWRGVLYPEEVPSNQWFSYYAREFDTVELNNTFYHLPRPATVQRWHDLAPPDFRFAVKASRLITHQRRLRDCAEPLQTFFGAITPLGKHLGPVLYQLPPGLHADLERLQAFAALLPAGHLHVFEFRHRSWFTKAIHNFLLEHELIFCIHDWSRLEVPHWATGPAVYVRFHGTTGRYAGGYDEATLREWAERIHRWMDEGRDVYVYFNNDIGGHAVQNARTLKSLIVSG